MKRLFAVIALALLLVPQAPVIAQDPFGTCFCFDAGNIRNLCGNNQRVLTAETDCNETCRAARCSPEWHPPPTEANCFCIQGGGCGGGAAQTNDAAACAANCGTASCVRSGPQAAGTTSPQQSAPPAPQGSAPASSPILASQGPAKIPYCWLETDCKQNICNNQAGCFEKDPRDAQCTGSWGRCYPPQEPYRLKFAIGGKVEVQNLKDYIGTIWKFAAGIAATLATVMLIWGGIQWMIGGALDKIQKAKETIRNALTGLLLVLGSYVILYTINPALTELSLPRVAAIRQITFGTNWCKDLPKDESGAYQYKVAPAGRYRTGPFKTLTQAAEAGYTQDPATAGCNAAYYIEGAGDSKCLGNTCTAPGTMCLFHSNRDVYGCDQAEIGGEIAYSNKRYGERIDLIGVCKIYNDDGAFERFIFLPNFVTEQNLDTPANERVGKQAYRGGGIDATQLANAFGGCGAVDIGNRRVPNPFLGFFMYTQLNDDDAGALDDEYLLGKAGCSNGRPFRSVSLPVDYYSHLAFSGTVNTRGAAAGAAIGALVDPIAAVGGLVAGGLSGQGSGNSGQAEGYRALLGVMPDEYWTLEEVTRAIGGMPIRCDIDTAKLPTD